MTTTEPQEQTRNHAAENYGLRAGVLGPIETLAQSVSATAPSTSASLTIPLIVGLSGNATWFVYLLATASMLLVGFCVSRFARLSASPGSLYSYTANTLPPVFAVTAAWGLLLAYLATGASVAGGALYYATVLSEQFFQWAPSPIPTLAIVCVVAGWIAYRDVKLSAEVMLWIEAISVGLILIVLALLPFHMGLHFDSSQFHLRGSSFSSMGTALVLAIFSFVGFESATTLGGEARDPLRTIPRAVIQCALLSGVFFMLCAYSEVLGFQGQLGALSQTTSPLHLLARKAGVSPLGVAIDCGAFVSMFACVLACATAAARVLMRMSHEKLLPSLFARTSLKHGTPGAGILLSTAIIFVVICAMVCNGVTGYSIYDLLGSMAVFGFLTAYALVAIALPFARRAVGQHSHFLVAVSVLTVAVILTIAAFDIHSAQDVPHRRIPYLYLVYIGLGLAWFAAQPKKVNA